MGLVGEWMDFYNHKRHRQALGTKKLDRQKKQRKLLRYEFLLVRFGYG
jgi:hypothetical protein